jgi:glycosyltransferase involved in cell wall biosynthesis
MQIAIVTAGGSGMFCGSCMHDNTWAGALIAGGADVTLIPTYTPIRLDEKNQSSHDVFFGGINVYLESRFQLWRKLPRRLTRWLDAPGILNLAGKVGISSDAHQLGSLTLAMLDGEAGPQRREVDELADFLGRQLKPDVVVFSNALLVGALRRLRERFDGKVFCTLQGDDIFLDALQEPYRSEAIQRISERAQDFDGVIVHSEYYRDFMSNLLRLPAERFHRLPLGISIDGHLGQPELRNNVTFTIGYFARICPEKGLLPLVEAFQILHARHPETRLMAGGYLGKADTNYFQEVQVQARDLGEAFQYIGSPESRRTKIEFLQSLDLLSVPTIYREPKGLYVLEALANGTPVVQPRHGAFPELIEATGGGLLVNPDDPEDLARGLESLLLDAKLRIELAKAGYTAVRSRYDDATMAQATLALFADAIG